MGQHMGNMQPRTITQGHPARCEQPTCARLPAACISWVHTAKVYALCHWVLAWQQHAYPHLLPPCPAPSQVALNHAVLANNGPLNTQSPNPSAAAPHLLSWQPP